MLSMRNELIELKVWVSLLWEVIEGLGKSSRLASYLLLYQLQCVGNRNNGVLRTSVPRRGSLVRDPSCGFVRVRLMRNMMEHIRTLPPDAAEMVQADLQLDKAKLPFELREAHMLSMRNELIELKIWVSLLWEVIQGLVRWKSEQRRSQSVRSSSWLVDWGAYLFGYSRASDGGRDDMYQESLAASLDLTDSVNTEEPSSSFNSTVYSRPALKHRRG
ncbi:hypothetical protein B0H19DRAFT_1099115 [Mycena capillaripes]|nr:hypothetical protein B0H19DRAFT_1099115 [Mycena capillaripes]